MPMTYDIALVTALKQNMILVCVPPEFGRLPRMDQRQATTRIQVSALAAGLQGAVVAVWDAGEGRLGWYAPTQWRTIFTGMTLAEIRSHVSGTLTIA